MAGCGCGATTVGGLTVSSGDTSQMREAFTLKLAALGPADQCPGTREYEVRPRTSPQRELFTTRPGPIPGYAPDLVHTVGSTDEALTAALQRWAEVGGSVVDQCPPA